MMTALREKYPIEEMKQKKFNMNEKSLANFTKAYNNAVHSANNKELCTRVCAMINYVSSELETSLGTALGALGIYTGIWRLSDYDIMVLPTYGGYQTTELDLPSVLVYFGCCILILFKDFTNEENYNTFMTNSIRELRVKAKCDPDANAIRAMLGACSTLCKDAITFLFKYMNCENSRMASVCHYLVNALAWVDMQHLVLMNDFLIMPQSPVLHDRRVSREVENLSVAIRKVTSYPYPQFFMCMVSNLERFKVEPSMFPTLIAVAEELERGYNNNNVAKFESISTTGANQALVQSLVTLHKTAFPQNGLNSSNVQWPQVKRENPQNRSRTSNVQIPPMKQENPQKHSMTSNVQMPLVKQEKSSFKRSHVFFLD